MLTKEDVEKAKEATRKSRLLNRHLRFAKRYENLRAAVQSRYFLAGGSEMLSEWYGRDPIETASITIFRGCKSESLYIIIKSE